MSRGVTVYRSSRNTCAMALACAWSRQQQEAPYQIDASRVGCCLCLLQLGHDRAEGLCERERHTSPADLEWLRDWWRWSSRRSRPSALQLCGEHIAIRTAHQPPV